ncbi:MAG TPA: (2Fe-2S) ferredoxin domain-containing protein, partial [Syntrophales bacterium]|nr:(2Fe-2S) ferredoxin domain-containing protein [Syntrophales bacterium]
MPHKRNVLVCQGTGCRSGGSEETMSSLQGEIERLNLGESFQIKQTGCHGFCQRGPLVVVEPEGTFYSKVGPDDVAEIAQSLLPGEGLVERL